MPNLPDGKTLGMGAGYGKFRAIAGQKIKHAADTPTQAPLTQRKGPTALHLSIKQIAGQKVKLDGQEAKPKAYKGDKDLEPKMVELAKERFQMCEDAYAEIRKQFLDDLKFRAGDQWNEAIAADREQQGRPCLTLNQIPQFVREVTNEQRQNRPSIKVNPVDNDADVDTAEVIQGLIRHIEYDSGADAAYDTGFNYAAIGGFGYWHVTTEYSDPMSFDQDIKIKRIVDPLSVYIDPYAVEPDRSDMRFGFLNVSKYTKKEFTRLWPNAEASQHDEMWSDGATGGWASKDEIRVVDYYFKETNKQTICQLSDGSTILKETLKHAFPDLKIEKGAEVAPGATITNMRETEVSVVRWAKINGNEILEETEWAGKYIPIVPVLGDELVIDGTLVLEGIVRFAKDPQRQYNFMASATTETIGLAPKAPFIAQEGQLEGHEIEWQNANRNNYSVLTYKGVSLAGQAVPPPQRQTFEPAVQATTMAMMQAAADLRSVTGVQSAALGERSNEKSGLAIQERANQSQSSNYHYGDNLTRSLRYTGLILLDLVPKIYDAERAVRIIGEDGTQEVRQIGQPPDPQANQQLAAVERIYDLGVGKYDVTISTGPSYQTKRQEAVDTQLQLIKVDPQLLPIIGDILVGNMDIPGATEMAERLKKMLPPQLQDNGQSDPNIPPQVQQQLAELMQQHQQLTQALTSAQDDLERKTSEKAMELESKERIAFAGVNIDQQKIQLEYARLQNALVVADITAKAASAQAEMDREMEAISQMSEQAHEAALSAVEHQQGMEAQQQGAQNASQQSAQDASQQQPQVQPTEQSSAQ